MAGCDVNPALGGEPLEVRAGLHHRLYYRLPADARAPAAARRLLRDWLNTWRWPQDESDEVMLAVSEAVTNAVQHAAASHVSIEAVIDPLPDVAAAGPPRRAQVSVSDNGRWHPRLVHADRQHWGLALMQACTDLVELERTQQCTRVRLTSRPINWSSTSSRRSGPISEGRCGVQPAGGWSSR